MKKVSELKKIGGKSKKFVVIPILNNEWKVIVSWDSIKNQKSLMKDWGYKETPLGDNDFIDEMRGTCFYQKHCHPFIALPRFPKTAEEIGTLAHEASHAITDIFQNIAETKSQEVYSHSVGAVVREVLKMKPTY